MSSASLEVEVYHVILHCKQRHRYNDILRSPDYPTTAISSPFDVCLFLDSYGTR